MSAIIFGNLEALAMKILLMDINGFKMALGLLLLSVLGIIFVSCESPYYFSSPKTIHAGILEENNRKILVFSRYRSLYVALYSDTLSKGIPNDYSIKVVSGSRERKFTLAVLSTDTTWVALDSRHPILNGSILLRVKNVNCNDTTDIIIRSVNKEKRILRINPREEFSGYSWYYPFSFKDVTCQFAERTPNDSIDLCTATYSRYYIEKSFIHEDN